MLYTLKCPKCEAEKKGLNLAETNRVFICSKCGAEVKIDLEKLKEQK